MKALNLLCSVLLLSLFTDTQAVQLTGACRERCDRARANGRRESFNFTCKDDKCKMDCESCPKAVCDETLSDTSWKNWSCPEVELTEKCQKACETHRPPGQRSNYSLECSKSRDVNKCKSGCKECPSYFCDPHTYTFHCPWVRFSPEQAKCQAVCDRVRVRNLPHSTATKNYVGRFNFSCDRLYDKTTNAPENAACKQPCIDLQCPPWVCLPNNPGIYACPSAELPEDTSCCQGVPRPVGEKGVLWECDKQGNKRTECQEKCKRCHLTELDLNFVCDEKEPWKFFCPGSFPENLSLRHHKSYKGDCKKICSQGMFGGVLPYKLECSAPRYSTDKEKTHCQTICQKECLNEDCEKVNKDVSVIKCRGNEKELLKETRAFNKLKEEREDSGDKNEFANSLLLLYPLIVLAVLGSVFAWGIIRMRRILLEEEISMRQVALALSSLQMQAENHNTPHSEMTAAGGGGAEGGQQAKGAP